jgi:hypothetical protein
MTETSVTERLHVADVIDRYGHCLEIVPMDPNFHNISVGLYVKDGICTVWTFSQKPGAQERVEQIRDQLVALGGLKPVDGTHNQARFPCGYLHERPVKFLLNQAVGKAPDYAVYQISGQGEAPNPAMRLRMVVAGFLRYGEMEKVSDTEVAFPCGQRHDELIRLLLPYSRNISSVEGMIAAEALRGQMTTGTLGFTPT